MAKAKKDESSLASSPPRAGKEVDVTLDNDTDVPELDLMVPPYVGLGRMLRTAHMAFMRLFTLNLAELGITFGQFQHLQYLWLSDGITQVELAERIGVRPAASTAVLLSLEQEGYIRRVRNDVDRRKVNLFLTPKGEAAKSGLLQCAKATNEIARTGLSEKNLAEFHRIILIMTQNLVAATPKAGDTTDQNA